MSFEYGNINPFKTQVFYYVKEYTVDHNADFCIPLKSNEASLFLRFMVLQEEQLANIDIRYMAIYLSI